MFGICGISSGMLGIIGAEEDAVARPGRLAGLPFVVAPPPDGNGIDEIAGGNPPGALIMPECGGDPEPPPVGPNGTIDPGVLGLMGPKFIMGLGPPPPGAFALRGGVLGAS